MIAEIVAALLITNFLLGVQKRWNADRQPPVLPEERERLKSEARMRQLAELEWKMAKLRSERPIRYEQCTREGYIALAVLGAVFFAGIAVFLASALL